MSLAFRNTNSRIPEWHCAAGERWVLSAPTGWGKSVWLRQVALLRDGDLSTIEWNGKVIAPSEAVHYRAHWMYVPQTGFRSPETVAAHLESVLALRGNRSRDRAAFLSFVRRDLAELGLTQLDVDRRTLQELSGGELQALAFTRAVRLGPEGIFLDEPTSAMDPALTARVEAWFANEFHGAYVWITHDPRQCSRLLDAGAKPLGPG